MAQVVPGRMTAGMDGDFVVFLLGMRITKWWRIHRWLPVARAMSPMLRALQEQPELGFLGGHSWVGPGGSLMVQYWRTFEQLEAFAREASLPHRPAWRAFNRLIGASGDVGVWHETYVVRAGGWEAIYSNMPRFGLATAGEHLPVAARGDAAAQRLAAGRR
jgi:hypothetical protein